MGRWLSAAPAYDADGNVAGLTAARLGPLYDTAGRLPSVSIKRRQDAEALARLPDGSLLVTFEREHRPRRIPAHRGGRAEVLAATLEQPSVWNACERNCRYRVLPPPY